MFNLKCFKWIAVGFSFCCLAPSLSADQESEYQAKGKYTRLHTASDDSFKAYLVGPEQAKRGLLLIHESWGLNTETERWADQFAEAGYRVVAVDLFNCSVTAHPPKARKLMSSVNQNEANEKYAAALEALSAPGRRIAVMGRSYGASQALHAAAIGRSTISAIVIYYPYRELLSDRNALASINSPILAHFAKADFFLAPEKVSDFTSAIRESGKKLTVNLYDAKHGFDKSTGKNFDESAHRQALSRTQIFLEQHMR